MIIIIFAIIFCRSCHRTPDSPTQDIQPFSIEFDFDDETQAQTVELSQNIFPDQISHVLTPIEPSRPDVRILLGLREQSSLSSAVFESAILSEREPTSSELTP